MTKINRKDWRNLPLSEWNVATFHAYFIDTNREMYDVEYAPMRNWRFEQGAIKRALDTHGAATLKAAFDECFRDYRPNREYPLLTAGFAIAYRINAIITRMRAEAKRKEQREAAEADVNNGMTAEEVAEWL